MVWVRIHVTYIALIDSPGEEYLTVHIRMKSQVVRIIQKIIVFVKSWINMSYSYLPFYSSVHFQISLLKRNPYIYFLHWENVKQH